MSNAFRWGMTAATLAIVSLLLFARLGYNSLWDDEATTALQAQSVVHTGDTGSMTGHNILAHRNGVMIRNLHDRSVPPLPAYLAAPFIATLGLTTFAARLPFALLGLGTVIVMLRWLWRTDADRIAWIVFCIAIVGNVSLMLYSRNCRYYAPTIFFATCIAYLYVHYDGRRRTLIALAAASLGLLATQYIGFIAVYLAMGVDYLLWGRRKHNLGWREWLIVLGPVLVLGLPIVLVWNSLGLGLGENLESTPLAYKLGLIWLNYRDMNRAEFAPLLLLVLAPLLYFVTRNVWLLRGSLALLVIVVVSSLVSPQTFFKPDWTLSQYSAEVRYIVAVIPLCIAVSSLTLCQLRGPWRPLAIVAAVLFFWTNLGHRIPGVRFDRDEVSSLAAYANELADPWPEPYAAASAWINQNVTDGQSILVLPDYMMYPLMMYSPQAVYAWQLDDDAAKQEQFRGLPDIHFRGRVLPHYVIAFGPHVIPFVNQFRGQYQRVATLPVYWRDTYRPELFWRRFKETPCDVTKAEGIYVFRRRS